MKIEKIMLDDKAYIDTYIADKTEQFKRKAILVIPGGAYWNVCADREGEPIAMSFMPHGFNAFVLHYSVKGEGTFPTQLKQASLAIKHIKDNAEEYGIDKDEVYAVGFSAGGHLCASLGNLWDKKEIYEDIDMPLGYNKPKGIILAYPVISGVSEYSHKDSFKNLFDTENPTKEQLEESSIELKVSEKSVPAYIVHAVNDSLVPVENSLLLATQYSKYKIPFELHIYPRGEHGFALANEITWDGNEEFIQKANEEWVANAVRWTQNLI
ncbi:MAG: alpha/beta hydrolase [Clostridia bacterium]|nr:alpha/beta hydrolase [Clostridia bacterium]